MEGCKISKHWTQKSRADQIERVQSMIIARGGWGVILSSIGELQFTYYLAKTLGCTVKKAQEYIECIIRGTLAESNIERSESTDVEKH